MSDSINDERYKTQTNHTQDFTELSASKVTVDDSYDPLKS